MPLTARPLRLAALSLVGLLGCGGPSSSAPPPVSAPTAPVRMTLPRLDGGTLALQSLEGKPALITLFTTWCILCQEEASSFVRLHERFGPRGLRVLGIALNSEGQTPVKLVKLYVDEVGFRFPVLLAAPDDLELIGGLGQTVTVPRTVLLDSSGRIVVDQLGGTRFQVVERKILELLGR